MDSIKKVEWGRSRLNELNSGDRALHQRQGNRVSLAESVEIATGVVVVRAEKDWDFSIRHGASPNS
jgi:phage gp45-like